MKYAYTCGYTCGYTSILYLGSHLLLILLFVCIFNGDYVIYKCGIICVVLTVAGGDVIIIDAENKGKTGKTKCIKRYC